jgi:hypothetical protein
MEEVKIRFCTETKETETRFSYGHYFVAVSSIPDFLRKLDDNETVVTSEVE